MAKFLFIESKAINLDSIAYVDLDPYGNDEIGIAFVGSANAESYDMMLKGKEAEEFLLKLEAVKLEAV